jgi:uncharacterized protein (DUF3820 family)
METMKFGKFKGKKFSETPTWYQEWLLKQDWFKKPVELTPMQEATKQLSQLSNNLKGWDGYSRKGQSSYNAMFEAEMRIEDMLYCSCGNRKDENDKHCWSCQ